MLHRTLTLLLQHLCVHSRKNNDDHDDDDDDDDDNNNNNKQRNALKIRQ
jgi:hypothetical protein